MRLPCSGDYNDGIPCKRMTQRHDGHRTFVGCSNRQLKVEAFKADDWGYCHTCSAYEAATVGEETS